MPVPFSPEGEYLSKVPDTENASAGREELLNNTQDVRDLVGALLFRKVSQLLALIVALAFLQGCNIMHRPTFDEESGFQDASEPVSHSDAVSRKRDMQRLLEDPLPMTGNRALLSGISSEQRERIMEHFLPLFQRVRLTDFVGFLQTCAEVREKLGIMNFDRYEPQVLREALRNFNEPEYQQEKPALIVIIARPDESTIGGVQPLSVETYQVGRLLSGHKVFLFECGSPAEVLYQVQQLIDRRLIRRGNLRGVVIGSHGSDQTTEAGVTTDNLPALLGLSEYFDPRQADLVFANCYSGEDELSGDNLVNRALLLFTQRFHGRLVVSGCDGLLAGVGFHLTPAGALEDGTLRLQSLASRLTLGVLDNTYAATERVRVFAAQIEAVSRRCGAAIPRDLVRRSVSLGLCDPSLIQAFHRGPISPERYVEFVETLGRRGITLSRYVAFACIEKNLSHDLIERYVQSVGYEKIGSITDATVFECFELGITEELMAQYRQQLSSISKDQVIALRRQSIMPSDLQRLRDHHLDFQVYLLVEALTSAPRVTIDQLVQFTRHGLRDLYKIRQLVRAGVTESTYAHFCLLGIGDYYSILTYSERGIALDNLRALKRAGFDVSNPSMVIDTLITRQTPLPICVAYGHSGVSSFHDMNLLLSHGISPQRVTQGLAVGMSIYEIVARYPGPRTLAGVPR